MIDMTEISIGRSVIYIPCHAKGDAGHKDCENGVITSFNDHVVFVRYAADKSSKGTRREDLTWA